MIIPVPAEDISSLSNDELVDAYVQQGFTKAVAEAYVAQLRPTVEKAELPASMWMTIESAREAAEQVGHQGLLAEVAKSEAANVAFIKLSESEDGDLVVSRPEGVMVALMMDRTYPSLKVEGGITDPHITLAYLGPRDELSIAQVRQLIGIAAEVASRHTQLRGVVKGTGYFEESGAWYAVPHIPALDALRADLVDSLKAAGLPVSEKYDFTPHITLAYTEEPPAVDVAPFEVWVSNLTVAVGSFRYDVAFAEDTSGDFTELVSYEDSKTTPFVPIVKSAEQRFTLAPMYIPGQYDAHGDWSDPDELQQALWRFQRGDKLIALQHHPEAGPMGEAVEMMVVPFEHTWPMTKADGTTEDVTFPAGTPWLGVIWRPEVWELVKSGDMRGYSIGGRANLLNVEMDEESAEAIAKAAESADD